MYVNKDDHLTSASLFLSIHVHIQITQANLAKIAIRRNRSQSPIGHPQLILPTKMMFIQRARKPRKGEKISLMYE